MIVAVTGGTGFIGKHLISRLLEQGEEVRVLSRREDIKPIYGLTYYKGDLIKKENLSDFLDGVDVLYHCAGQVTDQRQMRSLHVDGTKNLIDAAKGRIGRWVQLSSVGVYGSVLSGVLTENSPIKPVGEYEITKAESDALVLAALREENFSGAILRPSNVFGTDMSNQSLFGMIHMIKRGLFFFIGKQGASANYIHVDNVVEGLLRCGRMEAAEGRIYNLSDHCSMEDLVGVISDELHCKRLPFRMPELPVRWAARWLGLIPGFPLNQSRVDALTNHAIYSIDKIQGELDYTHVKSMQQGLKELVAAYNSRAC